VSNFRRQVSIRMMMLTRILSHLPMKDGVKKKKTTEIHSATEVQEQERYVLYPCSLQPRLVPVAKFWT